MIMYEILKLFSCKIMQNHLQSYAHTRKQMSKQEFINLEAAVNAKYAEQAQPTVEHGKSVSFRPATPELANAISAYLRQTGMSATEFFNRASARMLSQEAMEAA